MLETFQTDLQKTVFLNTYSRWNPAKMRRETWEETTDRVMEFFRDTLAKNDIKYDEFSMAELGDLRHAMLNLEVLPSMRVVQMAGPALDRCNVGAYNCAYLPLKDWRAFSELLYILMQGTGCGFSVEQKYIDQLPIITTQQAEWQYTDKDGNKQDAQSWVTYRIQDTTEGWCDAFKYGLERWADGYDVSFDYSAIRPYGTPLKTKGGTSSGPGPLKNLLDYTRKMLLKHQGRRLSSLNVHDLACYCGSIVQVGGVRRAAEISLSDVNDDKMRHAKSGQFWNIAPERAMANNSAVYLAKPSMSEFIREWTALMESGTGERGIFNREGALSMMPQRRESDVEMGLNPCGEILLRPFQFCNLSIAVARPTDELEDLQRKVKLATQFGILQSLLTDFKYLRPEWAANCKEERLLGVDITGQMDNSLLSTSYNEDNWGWDRESVYTTLRTEAVNEAERLSKAFGIPMPAAVTCVKPSGNSSQLLGTSSGIHPRYAKYYIRRIRIGSSNPVAALLRGAGVPHFPEVGQEPNNPSVWVFEFPVKSPAGAITRDHRSATQQLEQWLDCKRYYTEHNPSCTIYVKDGEWLEVGAWVYRNWEYVGGLSFLPWDGGIYQLAPYEQIEQSEYEQRLTNWPLIDFGRLSEFEHEDHTAPNREFSCTGDKCEI